MPPGTLYVVATPLGNLGDLTLRAADILRQVPCVAAEDTRHSSGLLHHLGARPKLISFHAHSPARRTEVLLNILREGRDVALISDAGTPVISDPGAELVAAVREAGIRVVPIPGPSAAVAALSISGFPADRHLFLGFLPRKGKARSRLLKLAAASEWPVVLYEAPPRLVALLQDLAGEAGSTRRVVVARELTKLHEEVWTGTLEDGAGYYTQHPPRGEITVVLEGARAAEHPALDDAEVAAAAAKLVAEGMSKREIVQRLTRSTGLSRNHVYRLVTELA